jgi:hypothetical protein
MSSLLTAVSVTLEQLGVTAHSDHWHALEQVRLLAFPHGSVHASVLWGAQAPGGSPEHASAPPEQA